MCERKRCLVAVKLQNSYLTTCHKFIMDSIAKNINVDCECKSPICISTMKQIEGSTQKWIQCSQCKSWLHLECSFISLNEEFTSKNLCNKWLCLSCSKNVKDKNMLLQYIKSKLERKKKEESDLQIKTINIEKELEAAERILFNKEGPSSKKLLESLKELKVDLQSYHSGSFVGNHICKMLKKTDTVDGPFILTECLSSRPDSRRQYYNLLCLLSSIFNLTNVARFLNKEEIIELTNNCKLYEEFSTINFKDKTVTVKAHMLMKHVSPFAIKFNTVGLFSEQSIESMHNFMNQIHRRYNIRGDERSMMLAFEQQNQIKCVKNINAFNVKSKK